MLSFPKDFWDHNAHSFTPSLSFVHQGQGHIKNQIKKKNQSLQKIKISQKTLNLNHTLQGQRWGLLSI